MVRESSENRKATHFKNNPKYLRCFEILRMLKSKQ